jgi:hypothetical protein
MLPTAGAFCLQAVNQALLQLRQRSKAELR